MQAVTESSVDTWRASLALTYERAGSRTVLRRRHTGPLLVQRPFYPDGATCHTVILHPPAGIVGGDRLAINVHCHQRASALLTTPGATRYYGSDGRVAQQTQQIQVNGGSVEWLPQETIYFDRCLARQELLVNVDRHSCFIGWEVNCFGRPAGGHWFTQGQATIALRVMCDGLPLLQERLVIDGAHDIKRLSGLRGATVSATMLAVAPAQDPQHWLDVARAALPGADFAATQIDSVLAIRYLGDSAEAARAGFIQAWKALRPMILKKPAVEPRIWTT